jgi:glutathione S-transferase
MQVRPIKLFEHEQKEQWYLDINPNGRIPAIVDTDENGQQLKIWESGAILQYLVDRYDGDHKISYPRGTKEHWEMTCWVNGDIPMPQLKNSISNRDIDSSFGR